MDTVRHSNTSPCQCNRLIRTFSLLFLRVHATVIYNDAWMLYAVVAHNPSVVHIVRKAGADKSAPE